MRVRLHPPAVLVVRSSRQRLASKVLGTTWSILIVMSPTCFHSRRVREEGKPGQILTSLASRPLQRTGVDMLFCLIEAVFLLLENHSRMKVINANVSGILKRLSMNS